MKASTHPLPDKLSDLILVALEDLEKAENDPRYTVKMSSWHQPNSHCAVCFAGAVMAFGLDAKIDRAVYPSDFDRSISEKLHNLNTIRCGWLSETEVGGKFILNDVQDFDATDYHQDPERWKTEMVLTACALKELGL